MSKNRTNRSNIISGVILICLGLFFLFNTLGLLGWGVWRLLLRLWPLLLIIGGLNIILKKSKLWWVVPLVVILAFSGVIYISTQYPYSGRINYNFFNFFEDDRTYSGTFSQNREFQENIKNLKVDIDYKAGKLGISDNRGENLLYEAELDYTGSKPEIKYDYNRETGEGELDFDQRTDIRVRELTEMNDWNLTFSRKVPLTIELDAGAGKIDLDLGHLRVDKLDVSSGVSDLNINFNNYTTDVQIKSGATNIRMFIPEAAGVEVKTSSVLQNHNFKKAGLKRIDDDLYQSSNFKEAEHKIILDISTSASNINLIYR